MDLGHEDLAERDGFQLPTIRQRDFTIEAGPFTDMAGRQNQTVIADDGA